MGESDRKKQKKEQQLSSLDALKEAGTVIVADTGDFESVAKYTPQDSTTNPTLILSACQKPEYSKLVTAAVQYGREKGQNEDEKINLAVDRLLVEFGKEILKIVPGRVSTEVDARLSFDKEGTIRKAKQLIELYESLGISRDRVLIKIASTWEGLQAAKELEEEHNIHVNCTLLFSFAQAVLAAEANTTLISPFVGRIMDWYKAAEGGKEYSGDDDPGVKSVCRIYNYYKKYEYKTIVMGASFRNLEEVKALAGIDFITLSPKLLDGLYNSKDPVPKKLDAEKAKEGGEDKVSYIDNESKFRYDLNEDAMATEKLAEGIRKFSADIVSLLEVIKEKVQAKN